MESPAKENAVPISKPEVVSKIEATIPIISEKESSSNGMDAKTEKTPLEETYKEPTLGSGTKFDNEEDGALPELPQEIEEFKNPRLGEPLADGDSEKLAGDGDLDEILREALTSPLFEINGLELEEQLANSTKKGYGGDEPMDQAAWGSLPNNERLEANSGELGMSYRTLNMDMFGFAPPSSRNLGHVRYSLVSDNAKPLTKALSFEGAWKVASSENLCIPPGRTYNVETGILMYIGPNTYMQTDICGESPVQVKGSILDDYDFGMLRIVINNPTNENQFIKIGDVVANLIFTNLSFPEPTLTKEEQMRAYLEILQKSRNINRFPKSSKMGTTTLFPVLGSQNLVVDNADTQGDSLETSEAKRRSDNQKKDNLEANKEVVGEKTKETLQNEVSTSTITRSDEEDKFVDDTLEAALDSSKKTDSNVKSAGKHRWGQYTPCDDEGYDTVDNNSTLTYDDVSSALDESIKSGETMVHEKTKMCEKWIVRNKNTRSEGGYASSFTEDTDDRESNESRPLRMTLKRQTQGGSGVTFITIKKAKLFFY